LTTYFWDNNSSSSSSRSLVGNFPLEFNDDSLFRELTDKDSGLILRVGVERLGSFPRSDLKKLRIAISFAGEASNIFDELDRGEAETIYDRSWKRISVSKSVKVRNRFILMSSAAKERNLVRDEN
jgi:hypothetical protein